MDNRKELQDLIDSINSKQQLKVLTKEKYDRLVNKEPPAGVTFQLPTSTPKVQLKFGEGAIPKYAPNELLLSPRYFSPSALYQDPNPALCQIPNPNSIKLPTFSGSEPLQKGEVLIPLGEFATVDVILMKLEDFYGNTLLREVRQIEQEELNLTVAKPVQNSAASTNVEALNVSNSDLQKQLSELLSQMKKLDSRMSKIEQDQKNLPHAESFQRHMPQENSKHNSSYQGQTEDQFSKCPIKPPNQDLLTRLVGRPNEADITVFGTKTKALIDSESMVTCISESFYESLKPMPKLLSLTNFGLSVRGVSGSELPYKGYIEMQINVPCMNDFSCHIPALVVPETNYAKNVPVIIGTNFIRLSRQNCEMMSQTSDISDEWQLAFESMNDETP
ncbi:uncharacterized protein LOC134235731, partial [Saccostrea cucullata]|uniref:uncharacterized protein LOC134235731 n=1 Tax=Saccostrea cuccullata TaxID=36930 RepID=UPI002ED185C2